MNNSLYGGHDGRPFIITYTYSTVAEMLSDFAKGAECTAVKYGEYVLINCENKNNPEHGQIYRRGINYWSEETNINTWSQNSAGDYISTPAKNYGAVYIGTITGPKGGTTELCSSNYNGDGGVLNVADIEDTSDLIKLVSNVLKENYTEENFYQTYPKSSIYITTRQLSLENGDLVSGKENDKILYKTVSLEKADGSEAYTIIGFQVPYLVIDFEIEYIDGESDITITKLEDESHSPFYDKWKIGIPQITTVTDIYAKDNIVYAKYNDETADKAIFNFSEIITISATAITTDQSDEDIDKNLITNGICFVVG